MTTFTVQVNEDVAHRIRQVADTEQKEVQVIASQLLEWAVMAQIPDLTETPDGPDALPVQVRRRQIEQIFARNEW
jgi:hypothetical protein